MGVEERRRVAADVERLRAIVSRTPPWQVAERDGETVLWDVREDRPLATLHGHWTPDVARYLTTLTPYAALRLVELLWRIGMGHTEAVERQAVELLKAMRLDES